MKDKVLDLVYWNSPHEERITVALPFLKKKKRKRKRYIKNIPICIQALKIIRGGSNSLTPSL